MTFQDRLIVPGDVRTWTHNGEVAPDWVEAHVIGERCPNGSFLIDTHLGHARVHVGNLVIKHSSGIWARVPEEVPDLVKAIESEPRAETLPVGPGKVAQFGSRRKPSAASVRKTPFRPIDTTPPVIAWIFPQDLSVDPSYQRSIDNPGSRRLIASIAVNFDWRLCAQLVVSKRADGTNVIIDGQHRWAAIVRRGDIPHVPCCVFEYETPEDEARMFILANRARRAMSRLDDYHAALAAADDDALEINELVVDAGLIVARSVTAGGARPGEIAFTSSVAYALRRHGSQVVSAALTSLAEAFPNQPLYGPVFNGLVSIFATSPVGFDPDQLAEALGMRDSKEWNALGREARSPAARTSAMRSAILDAMGISDLGLAA